jgi:hypothetical protein
MPAFAPVSRPEEDEDVLEAEDVAEEVGVDVFVFVIVLELVLVVGAEVEVEEAVLEVAVPIIELEELAAFRST